MAEANEDIPDCENCDKKEPIFSGNLNYEAVNTWRILDFFGRDIDTFSGCPKTLRIEAVDIECNKKPDPDGLKWRVLLLEEKIFARRIKEFNARSKDRNKNK